MKIHILMNIINGPWGGGNTFLRALREEWRGRGVYSETPEDADVVLFNAFPFGELGLFKKSHKLLKQGKVLVHRIDGPIYKIRNRDLIIDKIIYFFNAYFTSGTIFQSAWSRKHNYELGLKKKEQETVVINAPNSGIFNAIGGASLVPGEKVRIIITSWSSNWRKGFDVYDYLDKNLDFGTFDVTFIGNSPIEFENITQISPLPSEELAEHLRQHHIFLTASKKDPCSNSLIEALHCGLPALVRKDGGHPEITKHGGACFESKEDVLEQLQYIVDNYAACKQGIDVPNLSSVADAYYNFSNTVFKQKKSPNVWLRAWRYVVYSILIGLSFSWKLKNKVASMLRR